MLEAMVDGETITEEEASAPGWIEAIRRRAKSSTTTTGKPARARIGARRTGAVTRVAAASRLPPLPTDHHRVIVRPRGGLDPTPKQPSLTPPTKHLPTTTKNQTATPTWADRVTGKGETRGYAWPGNLPQHENDEIRELKRELALLRKENEEFKALIRNMQQPSERAVETPPLRPLNALPLTRRTLIALQSIAQPRIPRTSPLLCLISWRHLPDYVQTLQQTAVPI
ncbi:hypothetical protein MRX96_031617 [Rhipicephalus microplus]